MRYSIALFLTIISFHLFSQNEVKYKWSGAITYHSAKVNAKMTDTSSSIRLLADDDSTFSSPLYSTFYSVDSNTNYMVAMEIRHLNPLTKYFYAIESGGVIDSSADDVGSFTTFANGPFSYSFVLGSCAASSNHKVFDVMRNMSPDFYLNMGDLHYQNPNSPTDINIHRLPYEDYVLAQPRMAQLLNQTPIAYMWDDHDFCGNDSDSTYGGKSNARIAYNEYVPHYPLGIGTGPDYPIDQAFTIGRVHFILTDLRSKRSSVSIMSPEQRTWFENECVYARDKGLIVAWMSSYSWSGAGPDNWGIFSIERTSINDFLFCNNISNLFIMSGDAHMLAIDNGSNGNFSSFACDTFLYPNFQAAALNNLGSYKGGVYSEGGYFMNPDNTFGQFGKVNVNDFGGDSICISFEGYRVDSSGTSVTMMNSYSFCRYLSATSVAEKGLANGIVIQPNPSNNLNIHFEKLTHLKSIKIISTLGNVVQDVKANVNTFDYSLSADNLPSAYYIVELETDKGIIKKQWIKNKQ